MNSNSELDVSSEEAGFSVEKEQGEQGETLELHSETTKEQLSEKKYFLHGNSSPEDSADIAADGLDVMEGRATLSCNLTHAFDWATSLEKRQTYSQSTTPTVEGSSGSIFVIEKPEEYSFGFANFTDVTIDREKKEIRGQPLKWASAYKQVGVFSNQDIDVRKKQLEGMKMDERPRVIVNKESFSFEVKPSQQTFEVVEALDTEIKDFRSVGINEYTNRFMESLEVEQTAEVQEIAGELVESTIESIVVTRLRTKALEIKASQGYTIYNYANKPTTYFDKAPEEIKDELLQWQSNLENSNLDIEWLDTYARGNITRLLEELE